MRRALVCELYVGVGLGLPDRVHEATEVQLRRGAACHVCSFSLCRLVVVGDATTLVCRALQGLF